MNSISALAGKSVIRYVSRAVEQALPASLDLRDKPHVVVGVSGGLDSMVLAHVLLSLGVRLHVVHVNYGLRAESAADQQFVQAWCDANDCSCHVHHYDPIQAGQSLQAVARAQRYAAFLAVAASHHARWVAVGHHANDQAETVLLALLRKAGPEGLAGMPASRPLSPDSTVTLLRPLLQLSRDQLEHYAKATKLRWRADASNASRGYRRNRLRLDVVPELERIQAGSVENMASSARLIRAYVDEHIRPQLSALWTSVQLQDGGIWLPDGWLAKMPAVWQGRVVLEALRRGLDGCRGRHTEVEAVLALLSRQVGRRVEFPGGLVWRCRGGIFVERASYAHAPVPTTVLRAEGQLTLNRYSVTWRPIAPDQVQYDKPHTQYLDVGAAGDELVLRGWTPGDTIRPLGMVGTKLVSDVLTDAQVPPFKRKHAPVVCGRLGEVVAILPVCSSETTRVGPSSQQVWELTYASRNGKSNKFS